MFRFAFIWIAMLWILQSCQVIEQEVDKTIQNADNRKMLEGQIGNGELKVKPRWAQVARYKGNKAKKTEPFLIQGREFRLKWKTKSNKNDDGELIVFLHDAQNPANKEIVVNVAGDDTGEAFLEGKGSYFLKIESNQAYEITVEEVK
jgi:hypothetical protein